MANYRKSVKVRVPSVDADIMRLEQRLDRHAADLLTLTLRNGELNKQVVELERLVNVCIDDRVERTMMLKPGVFGIEPPGVGKVDALVDSDPDYFAPWKRLPPVPVEADLRKRWPSLRFAVPDAQAKLLYGISGSLRELANSIEKIRVALK